MGADRRNRRQEHWTRRAVGVLAALLCFAPLVASCDDPLTPEDDVRLWTALGVGQNHVCAVDVDGNVFCWGSNDRGQLSVPADVAVGPSLSHIGVDAADVFAGAGFSCYLNRSDVATCWGEGAVGQLGNGHPFGSILGEPQSGGPWSEFTLGAHHGCGIEDGAVQCWGGDRYGASLGFRLPVQSRCTNGAGLEMWWCSLSPEPLDSALPLVSVSAGLWHTCGVDDEARVHCWGQNSLGQLGVDTVDECVVPDPVHGDGLFPCNFDPVPVEIPGAVHAVSAGASHSCAVTTGGEIYCWGGTALYAGQLGHGGTAGSRAPVRVQSEERFAAVSTSRQSIWTETCALTEEGRVFCWGSNRTGQLGADASDRCAVGGDTPCSLTPVPVDTEERFREIGVGEGFVCGLTGTGRILCWGLNDQGQLGDGTLTDRQTPMEILPIQ